MEEETRTIDRYQPLWGSWKLDKAIGGERGCELYRVFKEEWGRRYESTVKLLSFRMEQKDIIEAQTLGLGVAELPAYYKSLVGNILNEIELMYRLRGNSNIVAYEDHAIFEMEDSQGWDVLIRMEYLEPLSRVIERSGLESFETARLGSDICRALEACAREGIIHRDISDYSIFVSAKGEYKLGGFGSAREPGKGGRAALPRLSPLYMAPELYMEQGYDSSVDIYSLGIVMYKLLNRGRLPFLPLPPAIVSVEYAKKAISRRMSGEELPVPADAGESLGAIVLKACSFDRRDRYKSPTEFRQKLERYLKTTGKNPRVDNAVVISGQDCSAKAMTDKEETVAEAVRKEELEGAAEQSAVTIDNADCERRKEDMRFIRNACIAAAIAILAFGSAFFYAYRPEPQATEPVAAATVTPVLQKADPAPEEVEAVPSPDPEAQTSGEKYYNDGLKHLKHGRYQQAIAAFREAGKLGFNTEEADRQLRAARKKLELQKLNDKAMKLYENKDYENAIIAFAELYKADASAGNLFQYSDCFFRLAEKHNLSGVEYHNQGRLEQSLKEFETALVVLEGLKKENIKYDRSTLDRQYGIYEGNKNSILDKTGKVEEYIRMADECNRAGVQYFSQDYPDKAKSQFEKALEYLEKIRLLAPQYQSDRYLSLLKICGENLSRMEEKLSP